MFMYAVNVFGLVPVTKGKTWPLTVKYGETSWWF